MSIYSEEGRKACAVKGKVSHYLSRIKLSTFRNLRATPENVRILEQLADKLEEAAQIAASTR